MEKRFWSFQNETFKEDLNKSLKKFTFDWALSLFLSLLLIKYPLILQQLDFLSTQKWLSQ